MKWLIPLLVIMCSCSPSSGTRHSSPDYKLGKWNLYWWATATANDRLWLIETSGQHITLLRANLSGEAVHVWAGDKLEADQLGHLMLHSVIGDQAQHLDARWQSFLRDDWLLSLRISARR